MVSFDMQTHAAPSGVTVTSLPSLLLYKGSPTGPEEHAVRYLGPHSVEGVQAFLKESGNAARSGEKTEL